MKDRATNPNTGTVYHFPKDAKRYLGQVHRNSMKRDSIHACEHGHYDCALWDGGPCENEVEASIPEKK